jgi:peptide/nickel transport system permease protein
MFPVLLLIVVGLFFLLKLAPGDTVDALAGTLGGADPIFVQRLRAEYGLDQPLLVQLWRYLVKLFTFDFGWSYAYERPAIDVLLERLTNTLILMITALALAVAMGCTLGTIAARRAYSLTDHVISTVGMIFYSTPGYFLSLLLMLLFAVKLGWLPVGGLETIASGYAGWRRVGDIALHLCMPVTALSLIYMALYLRLMRASVLEVMDLDYVRTARAKGAGDARVLLHHIMRNALLPTVTMISMQVGSLLGGAVVIETIFSLPGLGMLSYTAVVQRDLNMLMAVLFFCAVLVMVVNFLTDLLYTRLDSRIDLK